ncbi:telomere length regulation ten1 [Diplodia corticola]|uniref:Telomere length regulation ten1 n=1 Tax=Diplodia corticola TaxID=236234 RepID=A0A1J9RQI8_9PEZI|nr:telomere length regulation ten1 [Diplodia corticola]OJD34811.1 telomere length regulation ten1 [Diplodia corticola]
MNGPPPSRLVFLSDLKRMDVGDKARFLGCVDGYDARTGTLTLKHAYPAKPSVVARVNIDHVLESVKCNDLEIGAWLNIIGYVQSPPQTASLSSTVPRASRSNPPPPKRRAKKAQREKLADGVYVQAIMLWAAGDIKLEDYEEAVKARKEADAELAALSW